MRDGDADGLYASTTEEERRCSSLDPSTIRRAWQILIEPVLRKSRYIRSDPAQLVSNRVQADASIWYADASGNPWRLVMIANQAEGGPKTALLIHMLGIASLFDQQGRGLGAATAETTIAGLHRFRPQLEALGIRRVMLNPERCMTWDEYESLVQSKVGR